MIPMRHSHIFRSRWVAILWAAGIIWLAVSIAGSASSQAGHHDKTAKQDAHASQSGAGDDDSGPADEDEIRKIAKLVG